jgi:hypothetical protein
MRRQDLGTSRLAASVRTLARSLSRGDQLGVSWARGTKNSVKGRIDSLQRGRFSGSLIIAHLDNEGAHKRVMATTLHRSPLLEILPISGDGSRNNRRQLNAFSLLLVGRLRNLFVLLLVDVDAGRRRSNVPSGL